MAEINIRDLSIGDWVRYDFPEIGKRNIQVNSIDEEDNHIGAGGVGASAWSDVSEFEPIPLTPEILEKNGISKTYESDEYAVYKGEGFNVTEYYTELWEFERHRNRLMIRNVHQLQRALRLAGLENEIEV